MERMIALSDFNKMFNFIKENWNWITCKEKKAVLLATPYHGNLGDHAIALAEQRVLEKYIPEKNILEIPVSKEPLPMWMYALVVGSAPVFITGGGFLGSFWMDEEQMVLGAVKYLKKNPIIIFPQTVYYENNAFGEKIKKMAQETYSSRKRKVVLFLRDKNCYREAKDVYVGQKIAFAPDMALRLNVPSYNRERSGALCCLRRDKEGMFTGDRKEQLIRVLSRRFGDMNIAYTDTVISRNVGKKEREHFLQQKWKEFARYELVVTDRLHGMIFALLTGTPCVAINNKSGKVKAVYDLIKTNKYIDYVDDLTDIDKAIGNVLLQNTERYTPDTMDDAYKKMEYVLEHIFKGD